MNQGWKCIHSKSTKRWQCSIGRRTAASFEDREKDIPDWSHTFTEGLVEGESGSSGSAGETLPIRGVFDVAGVNMAIRKDVVQKIRITMN